MSIPIFFRSEGLKESFLKKDEKKSLASWKEKYLEIHIDSSDSEATDATPDLFFRLHRTAYFGIVPNVPLIQCFSEILPVDSWGQSAALSPARRAAASPASPSRKGDAALEASHLLKERPVRLDLGTEPCS